MIKKTATVTKNAETSTPSEDGPPAKTIDIGTYDGGLEADDQKENLGGRAKELALDSSTLLSVGLSSVPSR